MPTCYITLSDRFEKKDFEPFIDEIRDIVADGLDSRSRLLDRNHIAVRIESSYRNSMLADIEIDIFAQFFLRRFFSRDKRANKIAKNASELLNVDCATWINLCQVGYSRHTRSGKDYYSIKADDLKILEERKKSKQDMRN